MPRFALACLLLALSFAANGQSSRAWNFDLKERGTYKVQVEHDVEGVEGPKAGATLVTYSITIGGQTQSRQLSLVVGHPFLPLVTDIPGPQKMRVEISGLPPSALNKTRVYVYDARSVAPGQWLDPAAQSPKGLSTIRAMLQKPASDIDLVRIKLVVDKLIDPSIDIDSAMRAIDGMADRIKAMPGFDSSVQGRLLALKRYIYESGPWNDFRPYQYDLDDPLGSNIRNKLLPNYIATRKGNCVTMPLLVVLLGQRLGLETTIALAPKHMLVKFNDAAAGWINLEATSGANPARDVWIRQQMRMSDESIANGVYMRPLSKKDTAAEIASTLAEYYLSQQDYDKALAVADLVLEYHPASVGMMTLKGSAFARMIKQRSSGGAAMLSPAEIGYRQYLAQNNQAWFEKAEHLGWREETAEEKQDYLQKVSKARQN